MQTKTDSFSITLLIIIFVINFRLNYPTIETFYIYQHQIEGKFDI